MITLMIIACICFIFGLLPACTMFFEVSYIYFFLYDKAGTDKILGIIFIFLVAYILGVIIEQILFRYFYYLWLAIHILLIPVSGIACLASISSFFKLTGHLNFGIFTKLTNIVLYPLDGYGIIGSTIGYEFENIILTYAFNITFILFIGILFLGMKLKLMFLIDEEGGDLVSSTIGIVLLRYVPKIKRKTRIYEFNKNNFWEKEKDNKEEQQNQERYQEQNYKKESTSKMNAELIMAYNILGAKPEDSFEDIRKKYISLIKRTHSDVTGDEENLDFVKNLNSAFDLIKKYKTK